MCCYRHQHIPHSPQPHTKNLCIIIVIIVCNNFFGAIFLVSFLHARLRTATLHHDEEGQAVLINLLLRNYLHYSLYDQVNRELDIGR